MKKEKGRVDLGLSRRHHALLLNVSILIGVAIPATLAGYACLSDPCLHGVCIDHLNSSFSCYCEDGFTGFQCQTNWDECWSSPCQNGGTCVDGIAEYTCHCPSGFTGTLCESEINECLSNPCQNNGTCEDFLDRYVCSCPLGYAGTNCEVDVSVCNSTRTDSKCWNDGICVDGPGLHFHCECTEGWTGTLCQFDRDECLSEVCQNGGACVNTPGSFACACQYGYTGRFCEQEVVHCDEDPCLNDALCVMENGNATCYCFPDFHGNLCQYRYNDCLPYAPRCFNGGTCIDGVDSFKCSCPPGSEGVLCECDTDSVCSAWPPWFMNRPYLTLEDMHGYKVTPPITKTSSTEVITSMSSVTSSSSPESTSSITTLSTSESTSSSTVIPPIDELSFQTSTEKPTEIITSTGATVRNLTTVVITELKSLTSSIPVFFPEDEDNGTTTTVITEENNVTDYYYMNETLSTDDADIIIGLTTTLDPQSLSSLGTTTSPGIYINDSFVTEELTTPISTELFLIEMDNTSKSVTQDSLITTAEETKLLTPGETTSLPITVSSASNFLIIQETTTPSDFINITTLSTATYYSSSRDVDGSINVSSTAMTMFPTGMMPTEPGVETTLRSDVSDSTIHKAPPTKLTAIEIDATLHFGNVSSETPIHAPDTSYITPSYVEETSSRIPVESGTFSITDSTYKNFTTEMIEPTTSTTIKSPVPTDLSYNVTVTRPDVSSQEVTKIIPTEYPSSDRTDSDLIESSVMSVFGTSPIDETDSETSTTHASSTTISDTTTKTPFVEPFTTELETVVDSDPSTTIHTTSEVSRQPDTPTVMSTSTSDILVNRSSAHITTKMPVTAQVSGTVASSILDIGFSMVETSWSSTESPQACDKKCMNGASCFLVSDVALCRCPFNYTGDICATYRYVSQPKFSGSSYLKIKTGYLSLRTGVELYIRFTSESPNGLIAYAEGKEGVFLMLLLRNSLLQFVFSCGLQTVSFLQGNEKLLVNSPTDVFVRLWWSSYDMKVPWGQGRCSARLQVNGDTTPVYSEQKASSPNVGLSEMFLGGLPSHYNSPLIVKAGFLPRLRGCISMMEINNEEIDSWLIGIEGENIDECGVASCPENACRNGGTCVPGPGEWSCLCASGYEGIYCERKQCLKSPCHSGMCIQTSHSQFPGGLCLCENNMLGPLCEESTSTEQNGRLAYMGNLEGYSSYSSHDIEFPHKQSIDLRLHFTTKNLDQVSLLVFLGRPSTSAKTDFMSLSLVRGYLMLTWNLGSGTRRLVTPRPLESVWHTHSVRIGRRRREAWMDVDTLGNVSSSSPGFLSSLETNYVLYLGGHPSWNFSHMPVDLHKLEGFQGCIFDVRLFSTKRKRWISPRLLSSFRTGQCGVDPCSKHACANGGHCQPLGASYRCICDPGWKGTYCKVPSHLCHGVTSLHCAPGSSCIVTSSGKHHCLCPFGKGGKSCDKDIEITDPHFSGKHSFVSLHVGKALRKYATVSFEFNATSPNGLLFLASQGTQDGDFIMLALSNSSLHLTFRLGKNAVNQDSTSRRLKVTLEEWHSVTFKQQGMEMSLHVNGESTKGTHIDQFSIDIFDGVFKTIGHSSSFLDTLPEVFIGGIPNQLLVSKEIHEHVHNIAFEGCIRKVVIGGIRYDLDTTSGPRGIMRGQGISDCDGTSCGSQVCQSHGECIPDPVKGTFQCFCKPEFTGRRCQTHLNCLDHQCSKDAQCIPRVGEASDIISHENMVLSDENFNYTCSCPVGSNGKYCERNDVISSAFMTGSSYGVVQHGPFLGIHDSTRDLFTFNFSTVSPNGLIIWKGDLHRSGADFIGIGVWREKLKVVWHLGGDNVESIVMADSVVNSQWHSLVVTRKGRLVSVFLDGKSFKKSTVGDFFQLNAPHKVYIGGFPKQAPVSYVTDSHFENGFTGCLRNLLLHPGTSSVVFSQLREGEGFSKCDSPTVKFRNLNTFT